MGEPVVERGQHVAGAGGLLGLTLDLEPVAARRDIDAEPVFDRDQILVIFAEQARQQLRLVEEDFEPGTFAGLFLQSGSFFTPEHDIQERGFERWARVTAFVAEVLSGGVGSGAAPAVLTCGAGEENIHNNREMAAALGEHLHELGDLHNYTAWRDALDPHLTNLLAALW